MDFKLGNVLLGGLIGVLVVTIAEYLFYSNFSIRVLMVQIATVLIIYFLFFLFSYKKKTTKQ